LLQGILVVAQVNFQATTCRSACAVNGIGDESTPSCDHDAEEKAESRQYHPSQRKRESAGRLVRRARNEREQVTRVIERQPDDNERRQRACDTYQLFATERRHAEQSTARPSVLEIPGDYSFQRSFWLNTNLLPGLTPLTILVKSMQPPCVRNLDRVRRDLILSGKQTHSHFAAVAVLRRQRINLWTMQDVV
jgi:hypothetical protein